MTHADVCLLLEGTYPYVRGGVSSWVHQIISGLPEFTFSLVFVGSRRQDYSDAKYVLPANVVHIEKHYLEDAYAGYVPTRKPVSARKLAKVTELHDYLSSRAGKCPMSEAESAR